MSITNTSLELAVFQQSIIKESEMGTKENKAIVKQWVEGANKLDKSALELLANNFVYHVMWHNPPMEVNREFIKKFFDNPQPLSDMSLSIGDIIAEGDKVVILETVTGTHTGNMMNIEPTGKTVTHHRFTIYRIEERKIAKGWGLDNRLGIFQQLGITPPIE